MPPKTLIVGKPKQQPLQNSIANKMFPIFGKQKGLSTMQSKNFETTVTKQQQSPLDISLMEDELYKRRNDPNHFPKRYPNESPKDLQIWRTRYFSQRRMNREPDRKFGEMKPGEFLGSGPTHHRDDWTPPEQ